MKRTTSNGLLTVLACLVLVGCGTSLPDSAEQGRHIDPPDVSAAGTDIPEIVRPLPMLAQPQAEAEPELYSVVVQDVPVREVLFAMARDASINIDVHPDVSGLVSLNAINQTLAQILERISRQVDMRWSFDSSNGLVVEADSPFFRTYRVDYVNVDRSSTTNATVTTSIVGVGGAQSTAGANNSVASLNQSSNNVFWTTLAANLRAILGEASTATETASAVVSNPESGIITVRATGQQHEEIAAFLDYVRTRALYQVLIEATVVEVNLSDSYQAGVDWQVLDRDNGTVNFIQSLSGLNLSEAPSSLLTIDRSAGPDAISAAIRMLGQFGEIRVLSSPKIMALNNQAAMLRVVDNKVYFTIEVQAGTPATATTPGTPALYTSTVNTVPVGFVMTVTPQIGEDDQVTLNVRPTISRIVGYVSDPSPALAEAGVTNEVPEVQIREIESILKVYSGQIAVLGGLMQDSLDNSTSGLPGLSRLPAVRNLFSYRDDTATKTELIVFIRPIVVKQPSLDGDLREYRDLLPEDGVVGINNFYPAPTNSVRGQ